MPGPGWTHLCIETEVLVYICCSVPRTTVMGNRQDYVTVLKCCSVITSFLYLTTFNNGLVNAAGDVKDQPAPKETPRGPPPGGQASNSNSKCKPTNTPSQARALMIVSTMDGKVSALNVADGGKLMWTMDTRPLLSSSISKLEVSSNGVITRIIPSLDGGLYQFDGETVEAVPFTADTLLSHSFRFNDESTIVGGKHSNTYGLDVDTGKLRYTCTSDGCQQFNGEDGDSTLGDVVMLTHNAKTVRAVEMRTGAEKWNFSVGEHEITYISQAASDPHTVGAIADNTVIPPPTPPDYEDEEVIVESCSTQENEDFFQFPWWDADQETESANNEDQNRNVELKVVVPSGMVIAVAKNDEATVVWKFKFDSPIANAWMLNGDELDSMDLFDPRNIPALSQEHSDKIPDPVPPPPAMYIGMHKNQVYVQPSVQIVHAFEDSLASAMRRDRVHISMPKIQWRPYMASSPSRTPAMIEERDPVLITWDQEKEYLESETQMSIWHEDYPYDPGYYLYYESQDDPIQLLPDVPPTFDNLYYDTDITVTLWNWWKEVAAISVLTSVLVHLAIVKLFYRGANQRQQLISESDSTADLPGANMLPTSTDTRDTTQSYVSRYYDEFDEIACLGKGGFGIVYQASNKLDDCHYAIKRISLQNSEKARKKVGREVKALAKLDHVGIVRYYQAWFECPPPGWQEEKDKVWEDDSTTTMPGMVASTEHSPSQSISMYPGGKSNPLTPTNINPLKPFNEKMFGSGDFQHGDEQFMEESGWSTTSDNAHKFGGGESSNSAIQEKQKLHQSSSQGFQLDSEQKELEESGSFSLGVGSLGTEFANSEEDSSSMPYIENSENNKKKVHYNIPFKHYRKISEDSFLEDSCDVVFANSEGGEKSNEQSQHKDSSNDKQIIPEDTNEPSATPSQSPKEANVPSQRPDSLPVTAQAQTSTPLPKLYLYIQMQLCKKESLKEWLATNTLNRSREQSVDIFKQIVSAVDYFHDSGLIHRDLKPSNIFFSIDGTVKVGDFGLATEECASSEGMTPLQPDCKKHTDQVGTKLYMSPEQMRGKQYTNKVDIYALGLIFFELNYPFATMMERGRTLQEVKAAKFPPRFTRELPEESEFVQRLLSTPDKRPSASEILRHGLLTGAGGDS